MCDVVLGLMTMWLPYADIDVRLHGNRGAFSLMLIDYQDGTGYLMGKPKKKKGQRAEAGARAR